MRHAFVFYLIFTICIATSPELYARKVAPPKPVDTRPKSRTVYNIRCGAVMSGDVTIDGYSFATTSQLSYGIGFEFPSHGLVASGLAIDIHTIKSKQFGLSKDFLNISLAFRRSLAPNLSGIILRPGLDLGFGRLLHYGELTQTSNFLTVKGYLELNLIRPRGLGWAVEFGFIGAPYGKAEGVSGGKATAEIRPIVRAGLLFH